MNQESHWNSIAAKYEDEIFDVFKSDKNKVLPKYFKKHANAGHTAIDFGCGIGKAFPYLAPAFAKVLAIDISAECINIARQRPHNNIKFMRADLSKSNFHFPLADFAFCCNVIMLPEVEKDFMMIQNIGKSLKKGGNALIVVPSMESIFYSSWRLMDWYKREGVASEDIPNSEMDYFKAGKRDIIQGIMYIDGVPTKHYSEPEIQVLFAKAGFEVTAVEKLEYHWNTEFAKPPLWMREPYPWDWLIECRKVK